MYGIMAVTSIIIMQQLNVSEACDADVEIAVRSQKVG